MKRFITGILSILLFLNIKGQDISLPRISVNDSAKRSVIPAIPSAIDKALVRSPLKDTLGLRLEKLYTGKLIDSRKRKTSDQAFWNVSVNGGYEIRIAAVPYGLPEDVERYKNGLRYGIFVGANTVGFITTHIGLGVRYNMFKTGNSAYLDYKLEDDTFFKGARSDKIYFITLDH